MKWLKRVGLVLVAVLAIFVFGWAPYWLAGLATIRRFTYNDRETRASRPRSSRSRTRTSRSTPPTGWR